MNEAQLKRYVRQTKAKRQLDASLREIKTELDELETDLLEQFADAGISSIKIDGMTVHMRSDFRPSVDYLDGESKDDGHARACAALEASGFGEFVLARYNFHQIRALAKELIEDRGELPQEWNGAIHVEEQYRLGARSA